MAFEQPKRRRFGQLFNRSQRKRKNMAVIQATSSEQNLLSSQHSTDYFDSRKLRRSLPGKRHLNADGSSFDELENLCKKLPRTPSITGSDDMQDDKENEEKIMSIKNESFVQSQRTLKSEDSSGRKLQMILEKLILEESKHKSYQILPQNDMYEKTICSYETKTPPPPPPPQASNSRILSNSSRNNPTRRNATRSSPIQRSSNKSPRNCSTRNTTTLITPTRRSPNRNNADNNSTQKEVHNTTPNSQQKFRFEMEDSNEQAKLYLRSRKGNKKKKKRNQQSKNQGDIRMLQNCDLISLEVKRNSIVSVSSCSIDSVLEEKEDKRHSKSKRYPKRMPKEPQEEKNSGPEAASCNASQLADEIKTVFINSYGIATAWLGSCVHVSKEEKLTA